jgi:rubrerythrin
MEEHQVIEELDNSKKLLDFIQVFMENYRRLEAKLPYHINLIDELRASENAHSRILTKLLHQKTPSGKFEIFESFIQYIQEKRLVPISFKEIQVKNPVITQEKERIDLWIQDDDYAIVIENKIHWAKDMDEQLSRYINISKQRYKDEQIYVIYLSPTYDKKPEEQTWGEYKDKFEARYLHLSFREDILRWIIDKLLPNVRLKDKFLSSALEQYIDHLQGKFSLRNINNEINMELQEWIKQEWKLDDKTSQEVVTELLAKKEIINNINVQIDSLIHDFGKTKFQELKTRLKSKYPNYQSEADETSAWVTMQVKGIKVRVRIWSSEMLCFAIEGELAKLPPEALNEVSRLVPGKDRGFENDYRYGHNLPRDAYDELYVKMLEIIEVLKGWGN